MFMLLFALATFIRFMIYVKNYHSKFDTPFEKFILASMVSTIFLVFATHALRQAFNTCKTAIKLMTLVHLSRKLLWTIFAIKDFSKSFMLMAEHFKYWWLFQHIQIVDNICRFSFPSQNFGVVLGAVEMSSREVIFK